MDPRLSKFQLQDTSAYGGLFTSEQCYNLSQKIMRLYDNNRDGNIENLEVSEMLQDAYRAMGKDFRPTGTDVVQYIRCITRRSDSMVVGTDDVHKAVNKFFLNSDTTRQSSSRQEAPKLNTYAQERLKVARRLFEKFDEDKSGYLTRDEVPGLLQETYKQMGIQNFQATEEDVDIWMKMADPKNTGRVSLEGYESLVLKSLEKSGIKIQ